MTRRARLAFLPGVLAACIAFLAFCRPAAAVERRVALVVGAGAYTAVPHLPNTQADATELATTLRRLAFDVDLVVDPDRAQLEAAVRRLGERASGADAALFFFAGHGVEVAGRNWLLPVSANPKTARDLPFEALDLGLIFDQLDGTARVSLFILDACRDSPFRLQLTQSSRGITVAGMKAQQAASGSLIAYATAPGTTAADGDGPHSPFSAALLKHIERPGLTVQQVLNAVRSDVKAVTHGRQIPWESSALEGDFYFVQAPAAVAMQSGTPPPPSASSPNAEDLFFRSIMDTRRPEEIRAFLERFPNGTYVPLVRSWAQRQPATPAPPANNVPPASADAIARLTEALRSASPIMSQQARTGLVKRYFDSAPVGRAIAVHPPTGIRAETSGFETNAGASAHVLDRCAYLAGRPCALIAEGNEVLAPDATGAWPRRAAPLLSYSGLFDPDHIPLAKREVRQRADLQGYRSLKGPKAVAWRPDGIYVETAANQHDAEARALDACNHDTARGDQSCVLYAVGDGVVLPRWHIAPATPASESRTTVEAVERIAAAGRLVRANTARIVRFDYAKETEHKAIAAFLPAGHTYRWAGGATAELAERYTLEGCQIMFDGPCVLLGLDLEARTDDPRTAAPRVMERVVYSGPFRLDRVPIGMERFEAVRNYNQLPGERAIAIRPHKALVVVASGKASRAEAERAALAECNPPGDASPCILYASGNQVVLPQRRTEAAR